ncbi:MAG: ATP-binding protein [Pseudomonadota bacterium]
MKQELCEDGHMEHCFFLPCSRSPADFFGWLESEAQAIIDEWVDRLSLMSPSYRKRPRTELYGTVAEAFNANLEFLSSGGLSRIQRFIDFITEKRLETGFPLSDVQKAFELFRFVVIRRLREQRRFRLLAESVEPINSCLSYTIHRFSDHFQQMHEKSIQAHARNLEDEIAARTAELADSERRYKTLVEEINDGYFVIRNKLIIFANPAFCRMHGTKVEDTLGESFLMFVAPEYRERVHEAYLEACAGRPAAETIQYNRLGCPPENAATEIRARIVDVGHGPMTIGTCRDISERVAMERKVRENERMAYIGHLTASLSHEIRNPLSSIKMNLQILSRKLELAGFDQRRLEITVREVSRLESILRQLLDTARPVSAELRPTDVCELVRSCVELMEPKASENGLEIVQRYPKTPLRWKLDSERLQQALVNLILNGIEAAPEGTHITVFARSVHFDGNRYLKLGVKDNGPGVSPEMMPQLFVPFSTDKVYGTGLGLSNVKKIVEAHDGTVEVRTRKGRGTTMTMRLPWIR